MSTESLKKIIYSDLNQFLEDLNRNFALIENSPTYKGLPGDEGNPGDEGKQGIRGTQFLFIYTDKFLSEFPTINPSTLTVEQINNILNDFQNRQKFLSVLGVNYLVHNDIIVLVDSTMLQYNEYENVVVNTGIAFNSEIALDTQLQKQINDYIEYYVANNETIKNLKTYFSGFDTYSTPYTGIDNSGLFDTPLSANSYIPYFPGITKPDGTLLENFKYFGFLDKEFPETNGGTIVFGSMAKYCKLIENTLNITNPDTYTSNYVPGESNTPSIIFLQDNDLNGVMFGRKSNSNLTRFGSIYKDNEDSIVIKSDMGNLATDYSKLIINRMYMLYNKRVIFENDLTIGGSLISNGNISSKYITTGEFIRDKTKYDTPEARQKITEIGYNDGINNVSSGSLNIFYANDNIFSGYKNNVFLTDVDGKVLKTYFRESGTLVDNILNTNLNDFVWNHSGVDASKNFITSNYFVNLIDKVNAIQQHLKETFATKKYVDDSKRLIYEVKNSTNIDGLNFSLNSEILRYKYSLGDNPSNTIEVIHPNWKSWLSNEDLDDYTREKQIIVDSDFFENLKQNNDIDIFDSSRNFYVELCFESTININITKTKACLDPESAGCNQIISFTEYPMNGRLYEYTPPIIGSKKQYRKIITENKSCLLNIDDKITHNIRHNFYTDSYANRSAILADRQKENVDCYNSIYFDSETKQIYCYPYYPDVSIFTNNYGSLELFSQEHNLFDLKVKKLSIYEIID